MEANTLPGGTLAYIGDAAFELLVRHRLIEEGETKSGSMNKLALRYVKATEQAKAAKRLAAYLTEEEADIFRRGRNANGISAPKSATVAEYRIATGLEALFGWLYLSGRTERAKTLFELAYPKEKTEDENNV